MPVRFPPQPVYPLAYDSDYTLFKVYNTSESRTTEPTQPWANEIPIAPVADGSAEIWGDNGFASIDGELFYYDKVRKNEAGKVYSLVDCARNLGGVKTKYNDPQTWVRGVVVADLHNQIALGIEIIEHVVLDMEAELQMLEDLPALPDDCCVSPTLSFRKQGSTSYGWNVTVDGNASSVSLDFGDGETTSDLSGVHDYCGLDKTVNPVLTVESKNCTLVMTPPTSTGDLPHRTRRRPPSVPTTEVFVPDIPMPYYPPDDTGMKIPPIQFPILELPSVLMPSIIISSGFPSEIQFVNSPNIPDNIIVVDNLPSVIKVESDIPSVIRLEATVELICGHNYDRHHDDDDYGRYGRMALENENFLDGFNMDDEFIADSIGLGIPSEIHIIAPRMPNVKVIHDLPTDIRLHAPHIPGEIHIPELADKTIPHEIHLRGMEQIPKEIMLVSSQNIPHTIFVSGESIPDEIPIRFTGVPNQLKLTGIRDIAITGIPRTIQMQGPRIPEVIRFKTENIPEFIGLKVVGDLPDLKVDGSGIPKEIRVTGMPESIEVKVTVPELPPLKFEKDQIELVYKGPPVPMQWASFPGATNEEYPCFMIVPCPKP